MAQRVSHLGVGLIQCAVQRAVAQTHQVRLQAHHDGLGFRVAKAAVVFDDPGLAVGINHQAGVQESGVVIAFGGHAGNGGQDYLLHNALVYRRIHHRGRGVGAHAAGIGAGIAVADAFVVLAGGHGQHMFAVHHDDKAGLFAGEEFLDDHAAAGRAEGIARRAYR